MAGLKDRLIQFILRGKDELSPAAKQSAAALDKVRQEAEELGSALDSAKDAQGLAFAFKTTSAAAERAKVALADTELRVNELRDALDEKPEAAG